MIINDESRNSFIYLYLEVKDKFFRRGWDGNFERWGLNYFCLPVSKPA